MSTQFLGWASSFVLLITVAKQIHTQWRAGTSEGVSLWLFVGQLIASAGFTIYSVLVGNWVFVATNTLMTIAAVLGLLILFKHRFQRNSDE